jgi:hypothetical protein
VNFNEKNYQRLWIYDPDFFTTHLCVADSSQKDEYEAAPGLIDLRSTFSDGAHTVEELVQIARSRGFKIIFINDHDRLALSYGVPPFRKIFRYKKELPSIMTHGSEKFLKEISKISENYPDMIIIPGCETSAYYYWTGSWFKKNLTVNEYDRRILVMDFDNPDDYNLIPNLHNKLSLKYTKKLLPGLIIFVLLLIIGFILLTWKRGFLPLIGMLLVVFSSLAIINYNPFRSSLFNLYAGDQGIAPYQEVIDYVNQRGGLFFWNYIEQNSGIRKYGPINVNTPPYPQVLYQSENYTGFSAIYGDIITATNPGKEWDRVLNEYCRGERARPVWGISTVDFHEDGRLGEKLGFFPTTFLLKEFSRESVLDAMKKGRMYCSRGDSRVCPRLDSFNVFGKDGRKTFMGETLTTAHFPIIKFSISYTTGKQAPINLLLIRGGKLIHTFKGETPMEMEYVDEEAPHGKMTYYRLMDARKHLSSNPIFVKYNPLSLSD